MSGPLEREFAQVREAFDAESDGFCAWCQCSVHEQPHASECEGQQALAVLSAIERHVQDMEKALEKIISLMSSSEESWEDPVQIARAALLADSPDGDCEHDYVFTADEDYRCDKCGARSADGVYPRVGSFHPSASPSDGGGAK